MPISIESDPTLAQGYLKVNGVTAATISTAGIVSGGIPAGAVMPFAMNSAPSGWLAADGSPVSRSTYATLFAAIGTTHGSGDGSTTFNLPDLRGIFVRGSGAQTISGTDYTGTFAEKQQDAFKSHNHTVTDNNVANNGNFGAGGLAAYPQGSITRTTSTVGGTETRPANIALLYCIKH